MLLTQVWSALAAPTAKLPGIHYPKPLSVTPKFLQSQKLVQIPYGFHATFVPKTVTKTVTKIVNRLCRSFYEKHYFLIYLIDTIKTD